MECKQNKIIKTKNIIFDKNSCYNFTDINLNQFINELFIEIDLLKLIQSNLIEAIEIDSNKKLKFDPYLPESKLHSNVESSDQTMLHVSHLNTEMFMPILDILLDFESDTIMFIPFN